MQIPVGGESAEAFLASVVGIIGDAKTHVYVDTSIVMWLTMGGPDTRAQFLSWADSLADRIHVPVWAVHEFHRHHAEGTLKQRLLESSKALTAAAKKFAADVSEYADQPLRPGFSEAAYIRDVKDLISKVHETVSATENWDYEASAQQVSRWISSRLCRSKVVFDLMSGLMQTGEARYTQDLPPGFLDRVKKDSDTRGSNRFGDFLFWEEILGHAALVGADTVVVLTRDRKADWYARTGDPGLSDDLRRLSDRWRPVPMPHATLELELTQRTNATKLVLLDDLYLGGLLWSLDRKSYGRFCAYALGKGMDQLPAPELSTEGRRAAKGPLSMPADINLQRASGLIKAALANTHPVPAAYLDGLSGSAPEVEGFIASLDEEALKGLNLEDLVALGRWAADTALGGSVHGTGLSDRLLSLLQKLDATSAAGIYLGFVISAYFEASVPRDRAASWRLQDLFELDALPAFAVVLKVLGLKLRQTHSSALFLPGAGEQDQKLLMVVEHDTNLRQDPVALSQIYVNDLGLLGSVGPGGQHELSRSLGGRKQASVGEIVALACEHYGLPRARVKVDGDYEQDSLRTLPDGLGFLGTEEIRSLADDAGLDVEDMGGDSSEGDEDFGAEVSEASAEVKEGGASE